MANVIIGDAVPSVLNLCIVVLTSLTFMRKSIYKEFGKCSVAQNEYICNKLVFGN
jgi:hypothetical protein